MDRGKFWLFVGVAVFCIILVIMGEYARRH
jgi:hypothetical protein